MVTEPNENPPADSAEESTPPEYKAIDASFTAIAAGMNNRINANPSVPALYLAEAQAHALVAQAVTLTGIRESLQQIASLMEDAAPSLRQLPAIAEALQVAAATFIEVTRDPGEPEAQADAERPVTTEDIEDSLVKRFELGEVMVDANLRPGEECEEIHQPAPGEPETSGRRPGDDPRPGDRVRIMRPGSDYHMLTGVLVEPLSEYDREAWPFWVQPDNGWARYGVRFDEFVVLERKQDGSPNPESAHRSQDMGRPEQNPPTVRGDE